MSGRGPGDAQVARRIRSSAASSNDRCRSNAASYSAHRSSSGCGSSQRPPIGPGYRCAAHVATSCTCSSPRAGSGPACGGWRRRRRCGAAGAAATPAGPPPGRRERGRRGSNGDRPPSPPTAAARRASSSSVSSSEVGGAQRRARRVVGEMASAARARVMPIGSPSAPTGPRPGSAHGGNGASAGRPPKARTASANTRRRSSSVPPARSVVHSGGVAAGPVGPASGCGG